jgi:hypothetical protein
MPRRKATPNSQAFALSASAHSRCFQPLFFDGALPAIIIFFALLQLFTQGRAFAPGEQPVQAPPPRIHLKNCVFRE